MSKVILDPGLRGKLNGLNEPVEVCEPTGETVGHFVPEELYLKLLYALARDAVAKEELGAASQEPGGRSWAEIRLRLGESKLLLTAGQCPEPIAALKSGPVRSFPQSRI